MTVLNLLRRAFRPARPQPLPWRPPRPAGELTLLMPESAARMELAFIAISDPDGDYFGMAGGAPVAGGQAPASPAPSLARPIR
jgi:hypothetical protein